MSKAKKIIFIVVGCVILAASIFFAGFGLCEYRYRNFSGTDRAKYLEQRVTDLESELEQRIADIDRVQSNIDSAADGVNECIRITGLVRDELEQGREELRGSNQIIQELRKRIIGYEAKIGELQESLNSVQESLSKQ
ncbi:MAG: hypothetical protein HUJ68_04555 [Clostridia bacterium]|nr:hypothetical protein [Clostridia bacterium]